VSREPHPLGEFEHLVLLAVLRANHMGEAYGITVYNELVARSRRRIARGAVYMTLDRLEKKGLLWSSLTKPIIERGGRSRRCYQVTKSARASLRAARRELMSFWRDLEFAEN